MKQLPMIIGSRAMDYHNGKQLSSRLNESSDWDIICESEDLPEVTTLIQELSGPDARVEWHDPDHLNNRDLWRYYSTSIPEEDSVILVAPPEMLYVLKRSHAWRARNFSKTITHLHKEGLVRYKPAKGSAGDAFLKQRITRTKWAYPQGNPNLNQSVEEFFDDSVGKYYEHDWLHEMYAYEDEPMFTRIQPYAESAWCSKDLWDTLTHNQKVRCVAEEAYVIATERFLVPNDWNYPSKLAFFQALDKICTTLCSGWFRSFAIDNYPDIVSMYDSGRVNRIRNSINYAELNGLARYHSKGE